MKLKNFIEKYVEANTLIRLWYKGINSTHIEVIPNDRPLMEHELVRSIYKNYKVVGVTDILYHGSNYVEAVNIVIK